MTTTLRRRRVRGRVRRQRLAARGRRSTNAAPRSRRLHAVTRPAVQAAPRSLLLRLRGVRRVGAGAVSVGAPLARGRLRIRRKHDPPSPGRPRRTGFGLAPSWAGAAPTRRTLAAQRDSRAAARAGDRRHPRAASRERRRSAGGHRRGAARRRRRGTRRRRHGARKWLKWNGLSKNCDLRTRAKMATNG